MVSLNAIAQTPAQTSAQTSHVEKHFPRADVLIEIGRLLREHRIAQGKTFEEVSHVVFIRPVFLQGLEAGNWEALPERVYVRGFVKAYGNYLGLDGAALAKHLTNGDCAQKQKRSRKRSPIRFQLRPIHAWLAYVLLVVGAVGGITQFLDGPSFAPAYPDFEPDFSRYQPEEPVIEDPPSPASNDLTSIAGVFPQLKEQAIEPIKHRVPEAPLAVGIQVIDNAAWVKVVADLETVFEGTLDPGEERAWMADASIRFRTGNAGSVILSLNGETLGKLGEPGQVQEQLFKLTRDGTVEIY